MIPSGERFLNHRTEPEFLSGAFSLFPKICRASAFTTAIATAMMPEMNSVRTPVERKPSISFLTRQSMERYSPTPGTSGIMPGMTKMVAGILYIRASISETKETVSAADRKPISSCPLSTNIIR